MCKTILPRFQVCRATVEEEGGDPQLSPVLLELAHGLRDCQECLFSLGCLDSLEASRLIEDDSLAILRKRYSVYVELRRLESKITSLLGLTESIVENLFSVEQYRSLFSEFGPEDCHWATVSPFPGSGDEYLRQVFLR